MNDVMFPEPMDPMDRAMQRMDKKAWAEADAEIATLKAQNEALKMEITHQSNTRAGQQRRAEIAETRLAEAKRLLRPFAALAQSHQATRADADPLYGINSALVTHGDVRAAAKFLRAADSAPAVCPHGIRWPWECKPCGDAAYEAHQRASASARGTMSAEEHCKIFCAWKGGGPCLADDCPRRKASSASAVQPERCCLDYPRCDCNSPPEPDSAPTLQPCGHPWKAQHDFKCILCSSPGDATYAQLAEEQRFRRSTMYWHERAMKAEARLAEAERLVAGWLHDGRLQTFEDRERVRGEMRAWLTVSASGGA